eukprot:351962-Chlamydomonas_euryale.AAC.6
MSFLEAKVDCANRAMMWIAQIALVRTNAALPFFLNPLLPSPFACSPLPLSARVCLCAAAHEELPPPQCAAALHVIRARLRPVDGRALHQRRVGAAHHEVRVPGGACGMGEGGEKVTPRDPSAHPRAVVWDLQP